MRCTQRHLRIARQPRWRAHFCGHGSSQLRRTLVVLRDDPLQQRHAFGHTGLRVTLKGSTRRSHGAIHVGGTAKTDLGNNLLCCRILHTHDL